MEEEVAELCRRGDHRLATERAIEQLGPEIYGFLVATLRDAADAGDVFSDFSEDLWRGIAAFEWRCSLRAWAYTLARHAALRFVQQGQRRPERNQPLSQVGEIAERVRSRTATYLRTESRDRLAHLRQSLDADEQALLTLRVDRGLEWLEIARVMAAPDEKPDDDELARAAARWRKRYQSLKDRLRAQLRDISGADDKD